MPDSPTPAPRHRAVSVATAAAVVLLAPLLTAVPATAHPWGVPPSAQLTAEGHQLRVHWSAEPDDAATIGVALGLMDPGTPGAYLEGPVMTAPPEADELALSAAPELTEHLLARITISQDGRDCEGAVSQMTNFVTDGAEIVFTCPSPVEVVDVRITMLQDVHPAYRTFAAAEGSADPAQAVFTAVEPEIRWDFSGRGGPGPATLVWWALGLGVAAGAIGIGVRTILSRPPDDA